MVYVSTSAYLDAKLRIYFDTFTFETQDNFRKSNYLTVIDSNLIISAIGSLGLGGCGNGIVGSRVCGGQGVGELTEGLLAESDRPESALPDNDDAPTALAKRLHVARVACAIPVYLRLPELDVRLREPIVAAALVPVPEAAVDEYHRLEAAQHDVGAARKLLVVQTVAEPQGM